MIGQCLPTTESLQEDWVLWVELWLRAVRNPELRPIAEELYARLHAWFADEIAAGVAEGEFERCDPDELADRVVAMLDGLGIRNLIGDSSITLERAQRTVELALARDLGLGEQLVAPASGPAAAQRARWARRRLTIGALPRGLGAGGAVYRHRPRIPVPRGLFVTFPVYRGVRHNRAGAYAGDRAPSAAAAAARPVLTAPSMYPATQ